MIGGVTRHMLPHLLWGPPDPHLHVKRPLMVTFNCLSVGVRGPVYMVVGDPNPPVHIISHFNVITFT